MQHTDWDSYYRTPNRLASVTRTITGRILLELLHKHLPAGAPTVVELGGANSCFYETLDAALHPAHYTIIDNNDLGLRLFAEKYGAVKPVSVVNDDVLALRGSGDADLTFSVGLIEHFDAVGTRAAIAAHFAMTRPGGLVLISFPTPTWLYRLTRGAAERLHKWSFPDERPLTFAEVLPTVREYGQVVDTAVIWPIFLTQGVVVAVRR